MYTKEELFNLYNRVKETRVKGHVSYSNEIISFLAIYASQNWRVEGELSKRKEIAYTLKGGPCFWWANPLWLVMYEKPFEDMPTLINVPVYGEVAKWRLEIGK